MDNMDNYLIDRETLTKLVDELIKRKHLPAESAEELNELREKMITSLDDKIGIAIFSHLTEEQDAELNELLDRGDTSEEAYKEFFDKSGLKIDQIIADTYKAFSEEFLGGQDVQRRNIQQP